MSVHFLLALVFGLAFIATIFVSLAWWKVLRDDGQSLKYFTVAIGTLTANLGVSILMLNRTIFALFGVDIFPWGVIIAGLIILGGKVAWMTGLTMNISKRPIYLCAGISFLWVCFCVAFFTSGLKP